MAPGCEPLALLRSSAWVLGLCKRSVNSSPSGLLRDRYGRCLGLAVSNALENLPTEVRGIASGIISEGYSAGYLIAAVINLKLVPHVAQTWRALFWMAAGVSFFSACVCAIVPESKVFLRARRLERAKGKTTKENTKVFVREAKAMIKTTEIVHLYDATLAGTVLLQYQRSLSIYLSRLQFPLAWLPGSVSHVPGSDQGVLFQFSDHCHYHWELRKLFRVTRDRSLDVLMLIFEGSYFVRRKF